MQDWDRLRAEVLAIEFVIGELIGVLADRPETLPKLLRARDHLLWVLAQGMEEVRDREFGDHIRASVANLFSALPD